MIHHTKTLGDIGVLSARLDLYRKGFLCCTPDSEHAPFDLVAYKEGKCYTVQVKARNTVNGCINISFRHNWADKNGSHSKPIDKSLISVYCVYCNDNDTCYYFNPNQFRKNVSLRIYDCKRGQNSNPHIKWGSDFLNFPY